MNEIIDGVLSHYFGEYQLKDELPYSCAQMMIALGHVRRLSNKRLDVLDFGLPLKVTTSNSSVQLKVEMLKSFESDTFVSIASDHKDNHKNEWCRCQNDLSTLKWRAPIGESRLLNLSFDANYALPRHARCHMYPHPKKLGSRRYLVICSWDGDSQQSQNLYNCVCANAIAHNIVLLRLAHCHDWTGEPAYTRDNYYLHHRHDRILLFEI
jgi:hypothetical protein